MYLNTVSKLVVFVNRKIEFGNKLRRTVYPSTPLFFG
jgi:hypothetical protein